VGMVEDRGKVPLTLLMAPADIAVAWGGQPGGAQSGSPEQTRRLHKKPDGSIRAAVCAARVHRQG
jgi:hypothetical protein